MLNLACNADFKYTIKLIRVYSNVTVNVKEILSKVNSCEKVFQFLFNFERNGVTSTRENKYSNDYVPIFITL